MCKNNNKCDKTFSSENMILDIGEDCDNIICGFVGNNYKLLNCVNCDYKDIDNENNFKEFCENCGNCKLCFDCFELLDDTKQINDLGNYEVYKYCNEDTFLCEDCRSCCDICEEYVSCEYDIVPLLDCNGDYNYICKWCVNSKELDIVRKYDNNNGYIYKKEEADNDYSLCCVDCNNKNYDMEYNGDLEKLTKRDLLNICRKYKIKGYSKLNKEDLIEYIEEHIDDMEDYDKEDFEEDFDNVLNDNYYFYKCYVEDTGDIDICCEECVLTNRYY